MCYIFKKQVLRTTSRKTTPSRSATIYVSFSVLDGMERAQLIFLQSFNIAISNQRVSLFAVLCAVFASVILRHFGAATIATLGLSSQWIPLAQYQQQWLNPIL